jgi:hypothetical protein
MRSQSTKHWVCCTELQHLTRQSRQQLITMGLPRATAHPHQGGLLIPVGAMSIACTCCSSMSNGSSNTMES